MKKKSTEIVYSFFLTVNVFAAWGFVVFEICFDVAFTFVLMSYRLRQSASHCDAEGSSD